MKKLIKQIFVYDVDNVIYTMEESSKLKRINHFPRWYNLYIEDEEEYIEILGLDKMPTTLSIANINYFTKEEIFTNTPGEFSKANKIEEGDLICEINFPLYDTKFKLLKIYYSEEETVGPEICFDMYGHLEGIVVHTKKITNVINHLEQFIKEINNYYEKERMYKNLDN